MKLEYRLLFPYKRIELEDIDHLTPYMYLDNQQTPYVSGAPLLRHIASGTLDALHPPPPRLNASVEIREDPQVPTTITTTPRLLTEQQNSGDKTLISEVSEMLSIEENPEYQVRDPTIIYPKHADSLFWCIYIAQNSYKSYIKIGHKYGNIEIEEKLRIIELMRANPGKIKDCPKRITKAQYQEIMSDFMTNKKLTIPMLTIFAIYCNLRIWIVVKKRLYLDASRDTGGGDKSISWYIDIYSSETAESQPIIIYCKQNEYYGIVLEEDPEQISQIQKELFCFDNYTEPLKAISKYKTADLENIAKKLGILGDSEKKTASMKKQDIYDIIIQKTT